MADTKTIAKTKVLYLLHNHPAVHPGGAEQYALELHRAMRDSDEIEPILAARTGTPHGPQHPVLVARTAPTAGRQDSSHPGSPFSMVENESDEYLFFTAGDDYDSFHVTSRDKSLLSTHFANFLRAHKPDVVHFQHTFLIGCDLLSQVRRVLPDAPILYTLHEYLPICNRDGQLLRTTGELCMGESPRRCHECFPLISPGAFYLRKRFIQSQFKNVDLFLSPSHFLRQRYIDWGIEPERIVFEPHGRPAVQRSEENAREGARIRLGFFGQVNPYKGIKVLLRAMAMLEQSGVDVHLFIHGANVERQGGEVLAELQELLDSGGHNVTVAGPYSHERLPALMAGLDWVVVPSTWWENSPLVIQEAFQHGRPVICSNVGGMAEKVADGVNGLHFEVGNPVSLAGAITRAVREPGLWEKLQAGIPPVRAIDDHVANLTAHYRSLLQPPNRPHVEAPLEASAL